MLEELKSHLRITWNNDDPDLSNKLESSKRYFNELVGKEIDFDKDLTARELLFERCRYVFNNAGDQFIANYQDDIMRLQMRVATENLGDVNA